LSCALRCINFNFSTNPHKFKMKPTSIILGALAAVATAAPTEKRSFGGNQDFSNLGDFSGVNNFGFNSLDLGYLSSIKSLDFALLAQLSSVNQFDVLQFGSLFSGNNFDVNSLLQFQQLAMLIQLQSLGAFNGLSLQGLVFNQLNFGLINNVVGFDFGGLIDQSLVPQLSSIANQGFFGKE